MAELIYFCAVLTWLENATPRDDALSPGLGHVGSAPRSRGFQPLNIDLIGGLSRRNQRGLLVKMHEIVMHFISFGNFGFLSDVL